VPSDVIGVGKPDALHTREIFVASQIRSAGVGVHKSRTLLFSPNPVVLELFDAFRVYCDGRNRVHRRIVPSPTKRDVGDGFIAVVHLWKRDATNPGLAILGIDVAVGPKFRLALVFECRIEKKRRVHGFEFVDGRLDEEFAPVLQDFLIRDRINQVLDQEYIIGVDDVADFYLSLGKHFNIQ